MRLNTPIRFREFSHNNRQNNHCMPWRFAQKPVGSASLTSVTRPETKGGAAWKERIKLSSALLIF